jgi:phosphonate transport system substrate-binding protein
MKQTFFQWMTFALIMAIICLPADTPCGAENLRIGFSRSIIGNVNENDAMAVIKVWAKTLFVTQQLSVDPQTVIYRDIKEMEAALREKQVEMISLIAAEYFALQHLLNPDSFIFPVTNGQMTYEYVLLVAQKSLITTIQDLQGKTLKFPQHSQSSLCIPWLELELANAGLPAAENFFKHLMPAENISGAVLPVFFKKADACLVTRKAFGIMAELNPQISRQLRILSVSPKLVPNFMAFRKDFHNEIKNIIVEKIEQWDSTIPGRHILTIFQTDALRARSGEELAGTLSLIRKYRQLHDPKPYSSSDKPRPGDISGY